MKSLSNQILITRNAHSAKGPWNNVSSLNFLCPTRYAISKSLKVSHWLSENELLRTCETVSIIQIGQIDINCQFNEEAWGLCTSHWQYVVRELMAFQRTSSSLADCHVLQCSPLSRPLDHGNMARGTPYHSSLDLNLPRCFRNYVGPWEPEW